MNVEASSNSICDWLYEVIISFTLLARWGIDIGFAIVVLFAIVKQSVQDPLDYGLTTYSGKGGSPSKPSRGEA